MAAAHLPPAEWIAAKLAGKRMLWLWALVFCDKHGRHLYKGTCTCGHTSNAWSSGAESLPHLSTNFSHGKCPLERT